ncbi:BlaI/MecI/CopY family transcriptional regulator [Candidatus Bathyarchaeota archaeon]|nr:BlaI/MecI/CopY family transcriptional regulator [Candidatus Bathyarchaeota archaeon]
MPARKMRVEVFDGSGNRYTITFQGHITREKAVRLLDLVELLGGIPGGNPGWEDETSKLSKFDRVRQVVERYFPIVWFTSRDVQSIYEQEFKNPISLSTVSTYLSRMADRGILAESKVSNRRRYRIITKPASHALSFVKSNK